MVLRVLPALLCISLAACGSAVRFNIQVPGPLVDESVHFIDARTQKEIKGGRDGFFAGRFLHGEQAFNPSKGQLFTATLGSLEISPTEKVTLRKFDVMDSLSMRIRRAQAASMASLSFSAAILMDASIPQSSDFILCVVEAAIGEKIVAAAAISPYRESPKSLNVFRDENYVKAMDGAVRDALKLWRERAQAHMTQRAAESREPQ